MRWLHLISAAALGASSIGCGPTPEKICQHQLELASKATDRGGSERQDRCEASLRELKKKSAKEFECVGKCIVAAKLYDDVDTCHQLCSPNGPSLGPKGPRSAASSSAKGAPTASDEPSAPASPTPRPIQPAAKPPATAAPPPSKPSSTTPTKRAK